MAYSNIVYGENTEKCSALAAQIADHCVKELKEISKYYKNDIYDSPEIVAAAMNIAYKEMCRIADKKTPVAIEGPARV